MAYKTSINKKKIHTKPYRIINRLDSESGSIEVWQLPKSQYGIQYNENSKKWRVMEVYVTDTGEIRTRGDLPYKDYESYSIACFRGYAPAR
jgi:hypothetical protein